MRPTHRLRVLASRRGKASSQGQPQVGVPSRGCLSLLSGRRAALPDDLASMISGPSCDPTLYHAVLACTCSAPLPLCKVHRSRTAGSCVSRPPLDRIAGARPSVAPKAVIDKGGPPCLDLAGCARGPALGCARAGRQTGSLTAVLRSSRCHGRALRFLFHRTG